MSKLADHLFAMFTEYNRKLGANAPAALTVVVAYGFLRGDERLYLCVGNAECLDVATRHDDRMPLTQADLNIETVLYHNHGPLFCDNCHAALTVHGPDPRD